MISDNVHSVQGPAKHKNSKCSVKSCSPNAKKLSTLIITLHGYTVVWRMKSNQDIRFEIKDEVRSFCLPLVAAVATPLFSFETLLNMQPQVSQRLHASWKLCCKVKRD